MNRRNAIKNIGVSFGALAITPTVVGMMQSCTTTKTFTPKFFTPHQLTDIHTILDLILPTTDDGIPGASQLQLMEFIDKYLHGVVEDKRLSVLEKSITSLVQQAHLQNGLEKNENLNPAQWEVQLKKYLLAENEQEDVWNMELEPLWNEDKKTVSNISSDALGFLALNSLRELAVFAFRINRVIGEEFLHYAPVPGQQKGCISLEEATQGRLHAEIGD